MIYFGTREQRNKLGDYIDEIDMKIYAKDQKNCSEEELAVLYEKRAHAVRILNAGFGIIQLPKE